MHRLFLVLFSALLFASCSVTSEVPMRADAAASGETAASEADASDTDSDAMGATDIEDANDDGELEADLVVPGTDQTLSEVAAEKTPGEGFADDEPSPYLDGGTRAELPAERSARLDRMGEWIDANIESNSGHTFMTGGGNAMLTFSVDIASAEEAAGWCGTYLDIANSYFFEGEVNVVALEGWVKNADGSFGEADWDGITC